MKHLKLFEEFNDLQCQRTRSGVIALINNEKVGEMSLYDYWSEKSYIDDEEILKEIIIPKNCEFVGMVESYISGKNIATNMFNYALQTTTKKGIAVSTLFIVDEAIHHIMKKINAEKIPNWYILNKN